MATREVVVSSKTKLVTEDGAEVPVRKVRESAMDKRHRIWREKELKRLRTRLDAGEIDVVDYNRLLLETIKNPQEVSDVE